MIRKHQNIWGMIIFLYLCLAEILNRNINLEHKKSQLLGYELNSVWIRHLVIFFQTFIGEDSCREVWLFLSSEQPSSAAEGGLVWKQLRACSQKPREMGGKSKEKQSDSDSSLKPVYPRVSFFPWLIYFVWWGWVSVMHDKVILEGM